jgi:methylmalonyl-CoA mutase C-terminal domain/subunit
VLRPYRVVVGQLGAPGAAAGPAGVPAVARTLRDGGFEVVVLGVGLAPAAVAEVALQEDADAVGVVVVDGEAGDPTVEELGDELERRSLRALLFVVGTDPDAATCGWLEQTLDERGAA